MPSRDMNDIAPLCSLYLSTGATTDRAAVICADCAKDPDRSMEDNISSCVVDASACFEATSLTEVFERQTSKHWRCNECGNENIQDYTYVASNTETVARLVEELAEVAARPLRIQQGLVSYCFDQGAGRSTIPHCDECQDISIEWDSFVRYDPYTGQLHDPQCFEAECLNCGDDRASVSFITCSAHEEIELTALRQRAALQAQQDLDAIFEWIDANGAAYGIDQQSALDIRMRYGGRMTAILPKTIQA